MRSSLRETSLALLLSSLLAGGAAVAQSAPGITRLDPPLTESGAAYRRATRFSRIERELIYVDQRTGEIPMGRPPRIAAPHDDAGPSARGDIDWRRMLIFGAILSGLLFIAYRASGGLGGLLVRRPGDAKTKSGLNGKPGRGSGKTAGANGLLAQIAAMPDRRAALILLLQHSLGRAAQSHDLTIGRSETARDILRRIPVKWAHIGALRKLVMAEELVQFGGRWLAEATFEECLALAGPILKGAR